MPPLVRYDSGATSPSHRPRGRCTFSCHCYTPKRTFKRKQSRQPQKGKPKISKHFYKVDMVSSNESTRKTTQWWRRWQFLQPSATASSLWQTETLDNIQDETDLDSYSSDLYYVCVSSSALTIWHIFKLLAVNRTHTRYHEVKRPSSWRIRATRAIFQHKVLGSAVWIQQWPKRTFKRKQARQQQKWTPKISNLQQTLSTL